ncbi:MAG: DUF5132 domain-containing protein [Nitrospirota bacterium]
MGIDDLFKGNIVTALAIGAGTIIFAPIIARVAKPVAKMAIKGGLVAYNKGREAYHDVGEVFGDLVAEIKSERHAEAEPLLAAAGAGGAGGTVARHVSSAKAAIKKPAPSKEAKVSRPKPAKKVATKPAKAKS